MRILHIIEFLDTGGAEHLLCNTIQELPEHEHLIVTVFGNNNLSLVPPNAKHISLGAVKKAGILLKIPAYKKLISRFRPHLVHAHLYFATVIAKAFTPKRIPVIFTQHFEFSKNTSKWYYRFTDRLVSSRRQLCIAVSGTVLKDYLATTNFPGETMVMGIYIPDHYFALIPHGIEGYNGSLKLVALGNIKPIKNQRYILDAFEHLKGLPVECDVYGDGTEREAFNMEATGKGLAVRFKGPIIDSSQVLPHYHLYIMPSLTEGFPLALFEAMSASLPPLVSDIPVFHELLGDVGGYLPLHHPQALRPIIERYLAQPKLLRQVGEQAKALAIKKASRSHYLRQLQAVYDRFAID